MRMYNGPHLHAVLKCLRAGYPENAVSWMWRDIGEIFDRDAMPHFNSLEIKLAYENGPEVIFYQTVAEMNCGVDGEGI